jgi:hypothetical protein
MPSKQAPRSDVSLQFGRFDGASAHRAALPRAAVARWIEHALARPAEIAVRIVGEAQARELNLRYRGKDYATNVLTFDYGREPVVMADLVLCASPCKPITPISSSMARCTRRAMTMKPASVKRWRWRRWKSCCSRPSASRTLIDFQRTVNGIVTGPSLTRCTCIWAANSPLATSGWASRACATR